MFLSQEKIHLLNLLLALAKYLILECYYYYFYNCSDCSYHCHFYGLKGINIHYGYIY